MTSVRSPFLGAPAIILGQHGEAAPEIGMCADPTGHYGVGLFRTRFASDAYVSNPPGNQHILWLQYFRPVSAVARIAGRRFDFNLPPQSYAIYPAEADSTCEARDPFEGVSLRVSAECVALAGSQLTRRGGTLVERVNGRDDVFFQIGQALEAEAAAGYPNGMLFWSSAADALIRQMTTHHLSAPATEPRGSVSRRALQRLDAYIHANLASALDLETLAAVVGCDRFHFAHRFRATAGMSPHRYVMRLRLADACRRIQAGLEPLAEIASETGFTDQSHLGRWIRRVHNLRPSDLRN